MSGAGGSHGIARTVRKRTEEQRQQDLNKISKYRDLEDQIRQQVAQQKYSDSTLLHLTTKLLRLNPEYYTIWNVRRRCLISGSLSRPSDGSWLSKGSPSTLASGTTKLPSAESSQSPSDAIPRDPKSQTPTRDGQSSSTVNGNGAGDDALQQRPETKNDADVLQSELQFTIPLLLEFPKCYWIWNHRSYILHLCISHLPVAQARQVWTAELGLVSKMLSKDPRNFHAWSYRRKVVAKLESEELQGTSMAEAEFAYTRQKIGENLSNFSAWHNRSQLILKVLAERGADDEARKRLLEEELDLARDGLNLGPEDQSLWYYHQFLMSHILEHIDRPTIAPNLTMQERVEYVEKEIEEIRDLVADYLDVKWIYQALLEYSVALEALKHGQGTTAGDSKSSGETRDWLAKLKQLDPLRNGRWTDVENTL
ncbi:hypothetical protein BKA67DRAFT_665419 [Truncatella angustata]|uniref:Geranylgeranyl transferase type-2 subunit alpha n=1 Tax=Truncatella angustata TaxID=152316 RepID=A0A9P8RJW8_9PEZI|nr:uncharacterized protein BKA67DRAFT_665419 [Truncatella angustata]KAH6640050.1 hypothetical protein BKA67DRAFT_665419 [Truncatella angustata]KAH8194800.1 hypothetical protein TruAng_011032 [Truncatella angustata]